MRDERLSQRLDETRGRHDQTVVDAMETVFDASGYDVWEHSGKVEGRASALREMARLAGLPQSLEDLHEGAYVDRHDNMYLPLELGERLAHAYAAAEPEIVLMYIEDQESEYKARGYEPGERYYHDLLREHTPGFALARHWAGHQEEVEMLRTEIERLRGLVRSAAAVLKDAAQEREAWRLLRALDGR